MAERTPAIGAGFAPMPEAKVGVSSTRGTTASAGKQSVRSMDGKVHTASESADAMVTETDHPRH